MLFEGEPTIKMKIALDAEDSRASEDIAEAGKGRPPKEFGNPERDIITTPIPS